MSTLNRIFLLSTRTNILRPIKRFLSSSTMAIDFGQLGTGQGLYFHDPNKNRSYYNPIVDGNFNISVMETPQRKSFSPDILTVSERVKSAMLALEPGARYSDTVYTIDFIRDALLRIARASPEEFTAIPLNGNGALATESVIRTMMSNKKGSLLVVENGGLTQRILNMCQLCGIDTITSSGCVNEIRDLLFCGKNIVGVVTIHCDPYTGFVMPVKEIGEVIKKCNPDVFYLLEATLSFGAMPIAINNIDFLVSNSGKSLQGAPGLAFVIARKQIMDTSTNHGDSLCMDLTAQYRELQRSGCLRFTSPSHIINAFKEALLELPEEGGVNGRAKRYKENNALVKQGMAEIGFRQLLSNDENPLGYLTTAYIYPTNPLFVFEEFKNRLSDYGYLICDNEMTVRNSFCVSNIGNLYKEDVLNLIQCVRQVCHEMRMCTPIQKPTF